MPQKEAGCCPIVHFAKNRERHRPFPQQNEEMVVGMAYLGEDTPKLGFGMMRLPEFEENGEKTIDIEQVKQMADEFMAAGFTYFDTAHSYHGGRSEMAVRDAIAGRFPRESYQIATKMPAWMAKDAEEAKAMFTTSLERMGTGYIDFYLLHNMGDERSAAFDKFGVWDYLEEQKEKGLIKHLGFSMHANAETLKQILDGHPELEFVQLQINYADLDNPSVDARRCYEVARAYGKPVIIMEPVKGGSLAHLPDHIARIFKEAAPHASEASWALRYAASLDGLVTVLSGMSDIEQMRENIATMTGLEPLSADEEAVIEKVRAALEKQPSIDCTDCKYCLDTCPEHIAIPTILSQLNIILRYDDQVRARGGYAWIPEPARASQCTQCGACEDTCPQHISVMEEMKNAVELLEV